MRDVVEVLLFMNRKVLASIEHLDGSHCMDIFVRDDGTFGFEEFRGEADGAGRWQSLGKHQSLSVCLWRGGAHQREMPDTVARSVRVLAMVSC